MVINNTYVNESVIARMSFIPRKEWINNSSKEKIWESYADILTIYGSQIQVTCTEEEYKSLLIYLETREGKNVNNL